MYESGGESGARKVITVVFIIVAIAAIGACAKIVLDHIDSDGTVTSGEDTCGNEEGMNTLKEAGVFGSSKPRCRTQNKK